MTILYPTRRRVNVAFALGLYPQRDRLPIGPSAADREAAKGECPPDAPSEGECHDHMLQWTMTPGEYRDLQGALAEHAFDREKMWEEVDQMFCDPFEDNRSFADDLAAAVFAPPRPTLKIRETEYEVEPIDAGECGVAAVRLHKGPGACYDVVRGHDGLVRCDCADYEFRRVNTDTLCKHGAAAVAAGLLGTEYDAHEDRGGPSFEDDYHAYCQTEAR